MFNGRSTFIILSLLFISVTWAKDLTEDVHAHKINTDQLAHADEVLKAVFLGDFNIESWKELSSIKGYINKGKSLLTTTQMANKFNIDVAPLKPKVVVVLAGVNDITGMMPLEQTANNFRTVSGLAKKNGINLFDTDHLQ